MKEIPKGAFGYTDFHKKRQVLKTFLFFLLPIAVFTVGYLTTRTKENYFTIVAVVGALPACKELVNVCLFWKRSSMPEALYKTIQEHAGNMETAYELVLTTYEKSYPVTALVIHGKEAAGYAQSLQDPDLRKAESHIQTVFRNNGISKTQIHLYRDLEKFLEQVDALALKKEAEPSFVSDERYPGFSREQVMREVILAISL